MFALLYKASRKSRIVNVFLRFIYKCDIPAAVKIGKNVTFNHKGLGVVIHPHAVIGDNVFIEHHVCLGQRTGEDTSAPVIRKNVVIGAYAIILGGIEIGEGTVIGAGSLVLENVPAHSVYYNPRNSHISANDKKTGCY